MVVYTHSQLNLETIALFRYQTAWAANEYHHSHHKQRYLLRPTYKSHIHTKTCFVLRLSLFLHMSSMVTIDDNGLFYKTDVGR